MSTYDDYQLYGGGGPFADFIYRLAEWGILDVILPFILIFTIVFAILQKSKILGAGKKNFNVVVAFVMAMTVVIPHIMGTGPDVVDDINNALPHVGIVLVAIIMALLLIGLLGGEARWMGGSLSGWIALAAFGLIVYIFGASADWWEDLGLRYRLWSGDTISIVIIILVFAIVIWYITKSDSDADKASKGMSLVKEFGDMFKGAK